MAENLPSKHGQNPTQSLQMLQSANMDKIKASLQILIMKVACSLLGYCHLKKKSLDENRDIFRELPSIYIRHLNITVIFEKEC